MSMTKRMIGIAGSALLAVTIVEVLVRILVSFHTFYDLEMIRYGQRLTVPSQNPRIAHRQRPNAVERFMGVEIKTNSQGFRDSEFTLAKGQKRRIVFLGDSVLLGWGLKQAESFEALLEAELNSRVATEVFNFGVANYNTDQQVQLFLEEGLKYRPDQVVVFFSVNDTELLSQRSRWSFLGHSQAIALFWSRLRGTWTRFAGQKSVQDHYDELFSASHAGWRVAMDALVALKRVCDVSSITLQVVILPDLHSASSELASARYQRLAAALHDAKLSFVDLNPSFRSISDLRVLWVASDDPHPNRNAHRMIAQFSAEFISQGMPR